jgi:chaperonin GroEL
MRIFHQKNCLVIKVITLGTCEKATITEFDSLLIGPAGDREEIKQKLIDLKHRVKLEDYKPVKERLQLRVNNIEGKTGLILVGGYTEVEICETRDKIVDCLNSCRSAIREGILPGGGTCFIHASKAIENLKLDNNDMNVGIKIFYEAIQVR